MQTFLYEFTLLPQKFLILKSFISMYTTFDVVDATLASFSIFSTKLCFKKYLCNRIWYWNDFSVIFTVTAKSTEDYENDFRLAKKYCRWRKLCLSQNFVMSKIFWSSFRLKTRCSRLEEHIKFCQKSQHRTQDINENSNAFPEHIQVLLTTSIPTTTAAAFNLIHIATNSLAKTNHTKLKCTATTLATTSAAQRRCRPLSNAIFGGDRKRCGRWLGNCRRRKRAS